jgi:hypothetical protein
MQDRAIDSLPSKARAAAVAAATEHVLDFYRLGNFSLQVQDAPGAALSAPPKSDLLEHAVQLAWSFAEGKPPSDDALDALLAGFLAEPTGASEEDVCRGGVTTLGTVERMVRSLRDETPYQAREALSSAHSAIIDGLAPVLGNRPQARALAAEELAWQQEVVTRVEAFGDAPVSRASLQDLIERDLRWREHLSAYQNHYR